MLTAELLHLDEYGVVELAKNRGRRLLSGRVRQGAICAEIHAYAAAIG